MLEFPISQLQEHWKNRICFEKIIVAVTIDVKGDGAFVKPKLSELSYSPDIQSEDNDQNHETSYESIKQQVDSSESFGFTKELSPLMLMVTVTMTPVHRIIMASPKNRYAMDEAAVKLEADVISDKAPQDMLVINGNAISRTSIGIFASVLRPYSPLSSAPWVPEEKKTNERVVKNIDITRSEIQT